jgi:hypothetical protein
VSTALEQARQRALVRLAPAQVIELEHVEEIERPPDEVFA